LCIARRSSRIVFVHSVSTGAELEARWLLWAMVPFLAVTVATYIIFI